MFLPILLQSYDLFVIFASDRKQKVGETGTRMALNTNKDLKLYYSIKEVAETIGVTETLLRYWEREFPQISPHKTSRQIRQYTKKDIETIRQIYLLVKVRGLKLSAAREALRQEQDKVARDAEVLRRLTAVKTELDLLRRQLGDMA